MTSVHAPSLRANGSSAKLPRAMFVQVPLQMQLREQFEGIYVCDGIGKLCTVVCDTQMKNPVDSKKEQ